MLGTLAEKKQFNEAHTKARYDILSKYHLKTIETKRGRKITIYFSSRGNTPILKYRFSNGSTIRYLTSDPEKLKQIESDWDAYFDNEDEKNQKEQEQIQKKLLMMMEGNK